MIIIIIIIIIIVYITHDRRSLGLYFSGQCSDGNDSGKYVFGLAYEWTNKSRLTKVLNNNAYEKHSLECNVHIRRTIAQHNSERFIIDPMEDWKLFITFRAKNPS